MPKKIWILRKVSAKKQIRYSISVTLNTAPPPNNVPKLDNKIRSPRKFRSNISHKIFQRRAIRAVLSTSLNKFPYNEWRLSLFLTVQYLIIIFQLIALICYLFMNETLKHFVLFKLLKLLLHVSVTDMTIIREIQYFS